MRKIKDWWMACLPYGECLRSKNISFRHKSYVETVRDRFYFIFKAPFLDFKPSAPLFSPHQFGQILLSDIGIFLWLGAIIAWSYYRGVWEMFTLYFIPYLWCVQRAVLSFAHA